MLYEITKKFIDISLEYQVDEVALYNLLLESFVSSFTEIILYTLLTEVNSSEMTKNVFTNLFDIYQGILAVLNVAESVIEDWRELVGLDR